MEKKAFFLVKFTDYVLGQNADRWRDSEPFLTAGDLKAAWASFFGSQPHSTLKQQGQKKQPQASRQGAHKHVDPRISCYII